MPDPEVPHGRTLARERTALAWNRSGLAVVGCVVVILRHAWPIRGPAAYATVALIAASAIAWAVVAMALSTTDAGRDEDLLLRPRVFLAMTVGTVLLALAGVLLTFVAP